MTFVAEITLYPVSVQGRDLRAVFLEKGGADLRKGIHFPGVYHRNGGGTVGPGLAVVVIEVILADGDRVGFRLQQVLRNGLVVKAVGKDFRLGEADDVGLFTEGVGHFHAAGQAGVDQQIIQVNGNGRHELVQVHFHADKIAVIVLSDAFDGRIRIQRREAPGGVRPGPGGPAGRKEIKGRFFVLGRVVVITFRKPAGSVRGDHHAVSFGRVALIHEVKGFREGIPAEDLRISVPDFQGVFHRPALRVPIHPVQDRGRQSGVVLVCSGKPGKDHQDVCRPVSARGKVAFLEHLHILRHITGQGIVATGHHDHDMPHFLRRSPAGLDSGRRVRSRSARLKVFVLVAGENTEQHRKGSYEITYLHLTLFQFTKLMIFIIFVH